MFFLFVAVQVYITTMSKGMPTAPSAPFVEEQHLVGHPPPPPSYEQAVGYVGFVPPPAQPAMAPFPQQNCKYASELM
jgi:hypothetical protein